MQGLNIKWFIVFGEMLTCVGMFAQTSVCAIFLYRGVVNKYTKLEGYFAKEYSAIKKRTLLFVPLSVKDFLQLGNIFMTGLPSSLGQGLGAVTTFFINAIFMDVTGKNGIVLHTICTSMTIFISSFRYAAASAMVPIVGTLFGERD